MNPNDRNIYNVLLEVIHKWLKAIFLNYLIPFPPTYTLSSRFLGLSNVITKSLIPLPQGPDVIYGRLLMFTQYSFVFRTRLHQDHQCVRTRNREVETEPQIYRRMAKLELSAFFPFVNSCYTTDTNYRLNYYEIFQNWESNFTYC